MCPVNSKMKFEKIKIHPAKKPAVLDTGTWEPERAWAALSAVDESYLKSVPAAVRQDSRLSVDKHCAVYAGSAAEYRTSVFFLAGLDDGQHMFVELTAQGTNVTLGEPIGIRALKGGSRLAAYRTDAAAIDRYVSLIRPDKGPKALGAMPRLGVGSRMTTAAWPGVWRAMNKCNLCANPIQNSVREVNLLDDVLVLDVRETADFGKGHIKNAKNMPFSSLKDKLKGITKYKSTAVVAYCNTGAVSNKACKVLQREGFTNVHNISGGINSWLEAKLPTTKK